MADRRKLQAEVDRCLKKVQEGVDAFEDIWQKVQSANNLNQKEKYEADLKKEIKKLQRLREQIKTWASSSEIKDKQILLDNRKLIETQMERFKVVEKETKTKAYSKEGLGAGRRLDPMEKEREEVKQWLQDCIEKLGLQSEKLESELEVMLNVKKKKGDKNDKVDAVKTQLQRHRHHIKSLEAILRLLTNESIEVEQVKNVQQDVDYYVDCNQDPNFEENEYIYEDFDLESAESFVQKSAGEDEDDAESSDRAAEALSVNSQPSHHPAADNSNSLSNHSGSGSNSTPVNNAMRDKDPPDGRKRQKSVSEEQQQSAWKNSQLNSAGAPTASQPSVAVTVANVSSLDGPSGQQHSINLRLNAGPVPGAGITRISTATSAAGTTSDGTPPTPPVTTVSGFAAAVAASLPPVAVAPPVQHNSYSNAVSTMVGPPSATIQPESVPGSGVAKGPRTAQQAATSSSIVQQQQPPPQQLQQKTQNADTILRAAEDKEVPPPSSLAAVAGLAPGVAAVPPPSSTPNSLPSSGGSSVSSVNNSAIPSPAPSPAAAPLPSVVPATVALMPTAPPTESSSGANKPPDAVAVAAYQNGLVHATSAAIAKVLSSTDSIHSLRTAALEAAAAISLPNSNLFNSPSSSTSNQLSMLPSQSPAAEISHPPSAQSPPESETTAHYQTSTIRISPLLGIAPLGQQMLTKENTYQLNMVSAAFEHMPHPSDSERVRHYIPRNPCSTPTYYPQALAPQADSVEYFQRLSTETLFFVFYYMEGTKAQYLAAKALKKQSWRFHTKYLMWFQRHDEPKTITDEYEQGTYIYFDYEKWGQRRKDGFTFEYRYLEDKEL